MTERLLAALQVAVAFRREIEAAADPDAKRKELEEELASQQSPFPRGEGLGVHELIPPVSITLTYL